MYVDHSDLPQKMENATTLEEKISDSTPSELDEPANYKEAMENPEAAKYKEAMKTRFSLCTTTKFGIWLTLHLVLRRINYEETFSPVAKIKLIRIMLAIAVFHDYEIWQMDVKTTFLNRKLIKDVFMAQPEGFKNAKYPKRIYKDRSKRLIRLSQDTYLDKILKRFKMENSKKGNLHLHHGIKINKDLCLKTDEELDKISRVLYALAIGSTMYAMACTRPDVSFALSMVSRHQENPSKGH
nr:retrotransposon protein, putative, Ty1-copia subclass [Tanacetum cinerariifolium]